MGYNKASLKIISIVTREKVLPFGQFTFSRLFLWNNFGLRRLSTKIIILLFCKILNKIIQNLAFLFFLFGYAKQEKSPKAHAKNPEEPLQGVFWQLFPRKNWSLANECETKQFLTEDSISYAC